MVENRKIGVNLGKENGYRSQVSPWMLYRQVVRSTSAIHTGLCHGVQDNLLSLVAQESRWP
jgi:hypothetical protein